MPPTPTKDEDMTDYHEPWESLPETDRDTHRALMSLKEEIEATDWYHQRVVLAADDELRAVMAHNRDEEIEHASMVLEWLRRNMDGWDQKLRTYLFKDVPIVEIEEMTDEEETAAGQPAAAPSRQDLGIGKLGGDV
jgi:ferritin-like protein